MEGSHRSNVDTADRRVAKMAGHLAPDTSPNTSALARQPTAAQSNSRGGGFTVAVLGAAGGIGQPLSLLMKQCPLAGPSLHSRGVPLDWSHGPHRPSS
jgi:hypothetical protein